MNPQPSIGLLLRKTTRLVPALCAPVPPVVPLCAKCGSPYILELANESPIGVGITEKIDTDSDSDSDPEERQRTGMPTSGCMRRRTRRA